MKQKLPTIEFARKRMLNAIEQKEDDYIVRYWRAYLDGAESQRKEDQREAEALVKMLDEFKVEKVEVDKLAKMLGVE